MSDYRLRRSSLAVHGGGIAGAIQYLGTNESPNLIILETSHSEAALMEALDGLAAVVSPDTRVVLIGANNDIVLYRRLISMGISEYMIGHISAGEIVDVVLSIFQENEEQSRGRIIAVYGTRGGVGSSALAANLAHALSATVGEDTTLVDMDVPFGTAALSFNQSPRQSVVDALAQPDRLDDTLLERFMLKFSDKMTILPSPASPVNAVGIEPAAVELLFNVLRRNAAYVVVDIPHVWQPWVRDILVECSELVMVTYPDLANLRDTRNLLDLVGQSRGTGAPTKLVFNRVGMSKKGELGPKDFEESLKFEPHVQVPFEPAVFGMAMNNGEPLSQTSGSSPSVKAIEKLAWMVSGKDPNAVQGKKKSQNGGLLNFLKR